ncbi:MAG: hypothetical protein JW737_05185 [Acidobacteria bacterium]|nr:hypothetical protein [Acidobacteriota bacterium]
MNKKLIYTIYIAAAFVIINLLVFFFMVSPKQSSVSGLSTEITDLRSDITKISSENRKLKRELQSLGMSGEQISVFNDEIIGNRSEKIEKILKTLDGLCYRFRLERTQTNYTTVKITDDNYEKIKIQFSINGDYRGIRYFISNLERSEHFFVIEQLMLTSSAADDNLNLRIALTTYFKKADS